MKGDVIINIDTFDILRKSQEDLKKLTKILQDVPVKTTDLMRATDRPFGVEGGHTYIDLSFEEMTDILIELKRIK